VNYNPVNSMIVAIDIREAENPAAGGKGVFNLNLVLELVKARPEITWWLLTDREHNKFKDVANLKVINLGVAGIRWHFKVRKYLMQNNADIYLSMTSYLTPYLLTGISNLKIYVFVHDLISFLHTDGHLVKSTIIENFTLPKLIDRVDGFFAVSGSTKNDLLRLFPHLSSEQVQVCGCGFEHLEVKNTLADNLNSQSPFILSVSTILRRKNYHTLIQAFGLVASKIPHNLVIVGGEADKKYADYLKQLVIELGLQERVQFLGFVSQQDLSKLYIEADFSVYPSIYEGFGIPLLEAFAHECPVISSNRTSLPEVAEDAAVYFNATDSEDLAAQILLLSETPALKKNLIAAGKLQLAKFSWEKVAETVLNKIKKV
jgi:glycosyltransferase involved in cell wall biosynthesis